MDNNQLELMFAKPTQHFIQLLQRYGYASQSMTEKLVNTDRSAYFIKHGQDISETVDFIEHHYQKLFLSEARRWLGSRFHFNSAPSFLDFSNCFSFDFHQNVYFINEGQSQGKIIAIRVQPNDEFIDWANSNHLVDANYKMVTLKQHLQDNATVVLCRLTQLEQVISFVKQHYQSIVEMERKRLGFKAFPSIERYERFLQFFSLSIHQYVKFVEKPSDEIKMAFKGSKGTVAK